MKVELICVGTELLLGNIVNTNAAFLSEQCAALGLSCFYQEVVGDNEDRLWEVFTAAFLRSDIVILSGGLGPTQDDLTKEVVAKALGRELYPHEDSKKRIEYFFQKRNLQITENNWKQAMIPQGSIILQNENGTAPGIIIEQDGKHAILLPGPPNELLPLFQQKVIPYLRKIAPDIIYSKTVKICGLGESYVETQINDLIAKAYNPTIAPYAKTSEVHLRITAKASEKKAAKEMIRPVVKELRRRFGKAIYTTKEEITLEQAVLQILAKKKWTLTTAESCTGGALAARLINVSGASEQFESGYITYSNEAKQDILGVPKESLKRYGAVSKTVAKEMAKGALKKAKADVAVSVTGIAGPTGGTKDKPVGLVYIACNVKGKITVEAFQLSGNRAKIREASVAHALVLLRSCLLNK